jgi:hypothetical protein
VIWNVGGALTLGAGTDFSGVALVEGAITGATSWVTCGNLYATAAVSIGSLNEAALDCSVSAQQSAGLTVSMDNIALFDGSAINTDTPLACPYFGSEILDYFQVPAATWQVNDSDGIAKILHSSTGETLEMAGYDDSYSVYLDYRGLDSTYPMGASNTNVNVFKICWNTLTANKAAADKLAAEKAEAVRVAAEKAKKLAAEKAEAEKLAAEKAEADRVAAEKAKKLAAEKAEADRLAAEPQCEYFGPKEVKWMTTRTPVTTEIWIDGNSIGHVLSDGSYMRVWFQWFWGTPIVNFTAVNVYGRGNEYAKSNISFKVYEDCRKLLLDAL